MLLYVVCNLLYSARCVFPLFVGWRCLLRGRCCLRFVAAVVAVRCSLLVAVSCCLLFVCRVLFVVAC